MLDILKESGKEVISIGKINDIFARAASPNLTRPQTTQKARLSFEKGGTRLFGLCLQILSISIWFTVTAGT
jgi:hypothetical protein